MKTLNIKGTNDLPKVSFDKNGHLYMGGSSLPENPMEFFNPIMNWLDEYKQNARGKTEIEFNFEYLNTASTNMMARIIEALADVKQSSSSLSVTWYYSYGDYDMKELGVELLDEMNINYNIVEIEE